MKTMKITLICAGGVSTSMLCKKIIEEGKKYEIEIDCKAHAVLKADDHIPSSDLVLVGPQIKYMVKKLQAKYPNKIIEAIDMRDYGTINAENIMKKYLVKE